ncbi:TonB-dependent receptor [Aliarcobacter butzleri]|uniref:TonB-dependent receptor n=1 Tax=Aliarcobacter butzleri TaxID=28197 RepID=UPI00214CC4A7|nr:TonB-dependent siderophore receptor [Aliarcobacter butzleri]MCP3649364.1 TonB-dependent siderophore receptor [Arcobacter sp. DNRA7]MCR1815537.1 TonB-dependent siderophore receptor [Aliarcobacter butzleri]
MKNRFFISVVTSLILSNNVVNAKEISLQEAVDSIVKEYKVTYISKSNSLKDKKIDEKKINYKENALNSLNNILESNDLKAIEEDGVIYIIEKPKKTTNSKTTILEEISVNDSYRTGSAESGYLTENITGVGLWGQRSLQDTPYSMNIISQELIENVQANDMAPIFKMNPITQDGGDQPSGNYNTVIRGFSSNNAVVNGMPLADFYSFTTMEDLERVETISGATGFLYGGGRVGGAVNYVTKKPTLEDKRSITVGNYGGEQYYGHIDLSGQIDEKKIFGYRINALYQDGDSVADVGKEQKFVSLAFDYKPTDNFTMDLNYAHRELERTNQKLPFVVSSNTTRPTLDVSKNYSPDWTSVDEENDRVMTSLKWDINDIFTLRSSLIYETSDREILGDAFAYTRADGLYDASLYRAPKGGQGFDSYAGNIYLDSKFETFGVNHLLTTGYSETYMKYKRDRNWNAGGGYWLTGKTLEEIKNTIIPANPNPHGGRVANWKTQYKNILVGDDIVFNDQWSALVGANYATAISTSYDNGVKDSKYDKSELTPTLSLMYKPFEDLTTYITYIESLEAGEPVGEDYKNEGEILDPYKSKQYEVGAKYSLNENILLTSALFRIEKSNSYEVDTTPKPTLTQDGEQIHQGMELTVTGKVTDNLTIFGGTTFMDIEVEKADNPAIEGKKPTNAATKMAKLYAEYNIPMIQGLTVTGGAYYTGEKYGNRLNTDKIPSYTLYDAGLRYKTKLDKYPTTFLLNVSNLTGEDYWASSNYLGDPRSVAFSMKMEF